MVRAVEGGVEVEFGSAPTPTAHVVELKMEDGFVEKIRQMTRETRLLLAEKMKLMAEDIDPRRRPTSATDLLGLAQVADALDGFARKT